MDLDVHGDEAAGVADCEDDDEEDSGGSADEGLMRRMRGAGRRMGVKVKERISYQVVVPPEMDDDLFVERNKELVTPGSEVQQYMKKELADEGVHVQTKSLKVEKAPYLEYVPGHAIVKHWTWWHYLLIGALLLIGCLGAATFCVLRATVSADQAASERQSVPVTRGVHLEDSGGSYRDARGGSPRQMSPQREAQGLTPPAGLTVLNLRDAPPICSPPRSAQGLPPPAQLRAPTFHETPRPVSPKRASVGLTPPAALQVPKLQTPPAQQSLPVPRLQPPGALGAQQQLQVAASVSTPSSHSEAPIRIVAHQLTSPLPQVSPTEAPVRILQDLLSDDFGGA